MTRFPALLPLVAGLALLLGTPLASALEPPSIPDVAPQSACRSAGPPCGYITPLIELDFPDKPRCPGPLGDVDESLCIPLLEDGAKRTFNGTMRWYWKQSEDGVYPIDASQPVRIELGTVATNPSWLTFTVEPDTFTVTNAELADPRNLRNETVGGSPVVWFWFERPITVTFERKGGPSPEEWERFQEREGVQPVNVKAKSSASGSFYREAFDLEDFRFNATALLAPADEDVRKAPAPALAALAATLAVSAAIRGRRRR